MTPIPSLRSALVVLALTTAALPAASLAADPFFVDASDVTPQPRGDVLEVAAASGEFQTFLAAVRAAGYEDLLRGRGPFTVFAPTDAAFHSMDQRELRRLMQPQAQPELRRLLAYHIVRGARVTTAGLRGGIVRRAAADGHMLTLDGGDGLRVNDELVVLPDMEARNGVIQGVNAVLTPPVLVATN